MSTSQPKKCLFSVICLGTLVFCLLLTQTSCSAFLSKSRQLGIEANKKQVQLDAGDLPWFNVKAPLTDEQLRGKLVILDFWTFCCINCIHVIPTLKKIEEKFHDEVLVIGVHSPKFNNEEDDKELKNAIMRYELKHPVIQDVGFKLWNKFDVNAWPTLMFISPEGELIGKFAGEPDPDKLIEIIEKWVKEYKASGDLKGKASSLISLENYIQENQRDSILSFPAKLNFDSTKKLLAVADANHNQIVIVNEFGEIVERIGSGKIGHKDGSYKSSSFHRPQGVKIQGEILWVADTENHLIRKIDLKSKKVSTVAGTTKQGSVLRDSKSDPLKVSISSPWDIEIIGDDLYFANAGTHQLGVIYNAAGNSAAKLSLSRFAGNGREAIIDGANMNASLAQPSGLWFDGNDKLFFADSETSAIRAVNLKKKKVETYIGTGLFDFGDRDGYSIKTNLKTKALLQHPIGLTYGDGKVFIADSYNHKIKILDLTNQKVETLQIKIPEICEVVPKAEGKKTKICLPNQLSEPAGLDYVEEDGLKYLYIADTNNHRILRVDLDTKISEIFL